VRVERAAHRAECEHCSNEVNGNKNAWLSSQAFSPVAIGEY